MNPPPIPPSVPTSLPPPPPKSNKTAIIVIVCVAAAVGLFAIIGVLAAILIPTVGKVRETANRTVDQSNLRQIAQAALIHASENDGRLPDDLNETIHSVAGALARFGGLNDAAAWSARGDPAARDQRSSESLHVPVLDTSREDITAAFADQTVFAWDFATGLTTSMSPVTPVAWTRGLRTDGTWDPVAGVYGGDGGFIAFLGGNVNFFPDLSSAPLVRPDGTRTSNILEALPPGTRIVGSGPGSLHGRRGGAAP